MSGGSLLNKALPYDAEIEYLEIPGGSSDTYWVDLGFRLHKNDALYVDFWIENNDHDKDRLINIFKGSNDVYNGNHVCVLTRFITIGQNYVRLRIADRWDEVMNYKMFTLGERHIIYVDLHQNIMLCDGQPLANPCGNNTLSPTLYDSNGYMNSNYCLLFKDSIVNKSENTKLYRAEVTNRANLIPVRVGTTGYLYDKVSGQLFGNAGTGSFILGPDK